MQIQAEEGHDSDVEREQKIVADVADDDDADDDVFVAEYVAAVVAVAVEVEFVAVGAAAALGFVAEFFVEFAAADNAFVNLAAVAVAVVVDVDADAVGTDAYRRYREEKEEILLDKKFHCVLLPSSLDNAEVAMVPSFANLDMDVLGGGNLP